MKTKLKPLALFFMGIALASCQSDEQLPPEGIGIDVTRRDVCELLDGGKISDIKLYCLNANEHLYGEDWFEKYSRTKVVKDYSEITMLIDVEQNASSLNVFNNKEDNDQLSSRRLAFYKDKCDFIVNDCESHDTSDTQHSYPVLFSAYINGEVRITCDKTLFGENPGTDLKKHFACISSQVCQPAGVLNPKLLRGYGDPPATALDETFADEVWLGTQYFFQFNKNPEERYDKITLHLEMPIKSELVNEYLAAEYKGNSSVDRYKDTVYEYDCKIMFDWD